MRDLSWLEKGKRIVFKSEPFELWRTGEIETVCISGVEVIKDSSNSNSKEITYVLIRNIVGEATDRVTTHPFYWTNVLEHLTEEAKRNL